MELKNLTKKLTTLAITALMATTLIPTPTNVSAASNSAQKKANKAYAQAIKKNKIAKFTTYSLIEVTGGGTKELVVRNSDPKAKGKARNLNIYTYEKGKVKKIWSSSDLSIGYNKKQKTLVILKHWDGGEDGSGEGKFDIYKYNSKKMLKIASYNYSCKAHYEDENGNRLTQIQIDDDDNVKFHSVIDKIAYTKKVNGKTKTITKKEYQNATKSDVDVWANSSTTKKALIKKLSK